MHTFIKLFFYNFLQPNFHAFSILLAARSISHMYTEALNLLKWMKTMGFEYDNLIEWNMWELIHHPLDADIISFGGSSSSSISIWHHALPESLLGWLRP